MEALALWALKLIGGLIAVLVVMAFVRASIRVFRTSKTFTAGFVIAVALGILYYFFSKSVLLSALLTFGAGFALYLIWIATAFYRDSKIWEQCRLTDTYQGYANYLRMDVKRFRKHKATELARRRLKEQIAFFVFLRHRTTNPSGSIPIALGNAIAQAPVGITARLLLGVSRDVTGLLANYVSELQNREHLSRQLSLWKVEMQSLEGHESARESIADFDIRLANAKEQIPLHESLIAQHHPLLNPEKELSPSSLQSIERRLESVLARAFSFLLPAELLDIKLKTSGTAVDEPGSFEMSLTYTLTSAGVGTLTEQSSPPKSYSYIKPTCKWSIELVQADKSIRDNFTTAEPNGWTNKYGIHRTYAYLLVRGYADFAWELLRAMGFVSKERYDTPSADDKLDDTTRAKSVEDLLKEFKKEIENVHESQLTEIASIGALGAWMQQNDADMRAASRDIEEELSRKLDEFFGGSLETLNSLLTLPEISLSD